VLWYSGNSRMTAGDNGCSQLRRSLIPHEEQAKRGAHRGKSICIRDDPFLTSGVVLEEHNERATSACVAGTAHVSGASEKIQSDWCEGGIGSGRTGANITRSTTTSVPWKEVTCISARHVVAERVIVQEVTGGSIGSGSGS
jgi:hypothetical protein